MLKSLSSIALAAASGLLALPVLAQDAPPPAPVPSAGPANLCQELVAFVKAPEAKKQEAATPDKQATAVSNPSGKTDDKAAASGAETRKTSGPGAPADAEVKSPEAKTAEAKTGEAKTSEAKTGEAKTGEAKVATPSDDRKAELAHANALAKPAGAPAALPPPPKPDSATIARIEASSASNDQAGCRAAALTLRKAGVPMPAPLLALAALDLKFQKTP